MTLVQVLLPLRGNDAVPVDRSEFHRVRKELTERFGGLTAHARSPAEGLWKDESERTVADDIVVYEVMVETFEPAWWRDYRQHLEVRFRQDVVVVRAWALSVI